MTYTPKTKRLGLRRLMYEEGLGPSRIKWSVVQDPMKWTTPISSQYEENVKTLELVSDPVARLVLSKRITADLAGQGIEVNFGATYA